MTPNLLTVVGYTNITTSDGIVHGQVKQSGKFAFLRIYDSGHEVPFYQPVVSLEMFQRAIGGLDMATGTEVVEAGYLTQGTEKSTYRQGNSTIQLSVVPTDDTYNTTTGAPNPYDAVSSRKRSQRRKRRSVTQSRRFEQRNRV
jgi:carboxypeptidase D